jgi:hypothetical protein
MLGGILIHAARAPVIFWLTGELMICRAGLAARCPRGGASR